MLALALAIAVLQTPESPPLRTLSVVATDAKGGPVSGLTAADVVVVENGVAREVASLELDSRPLWVAVVVDTSAPMATSFRLNVADAVASFLGTFPEGARFAVWTTGDRPRKVADFGTDPAQAARSLKRAFPSGGNTLLDALVEAGDDLAKKEGSRTVVVAVTGSGIGFSSFDRFQAADRAKATGAQFLAVQYDETGPPEMRGDGVDQVGRSDYEAVLGRLASETGGVHEHTLSASGVARALGVVAAGLTAQYNLTYRSLGGAKNPKVSIEVARSGVKVRLLSARQ